MNTAAMMLKTLLKFCVLSLGVWFTILFSCMKIDKEFLWPTVIFKIYSISGKVSGLSATGTIILQNNSRNDTIISKNGDFTMSAGLYNAMTYSISIKTQPSTPAQACTVNHRDGKIEKQDVSNLEVVCNTLPALAAGQEHTCALSNQGKVRCWGDATFAPLGYGNGNVIGDNEFPSTAGDVNLGETITQITANGSHTCALLISGNVSCWGNGANGRLGYGTTESIGDNESPIDAGVVSIGGKVVQISAGYEHTCALLETGTVRCWGIGADGRLGYGNTNSIGDDEIPSTAGDVNIGSSTVQIAAGSKHTCALLQTGAIRCWGDGTFGQTGQGHTNAIGDNESPSMASELFPGKIAIQIMTKEWHSCALFDSGTVSCWGAGGTGRLGYGNTDSIGDDELPSSVGAVSIGDKVKYITVGYAHNCALLFTGNVRCWGRSTEGQLGYGNTVDIGDNELPSSVGTVNTGGVVNQVTAGSYHNCVWLNTDAIRCWGNGADGRLGYGNTDSIGDDELPFSVGDVSVW